MEVNSYTISLFFCAPKVLNCVTPLFFSFQFTSEIEELCFSKMPNFNQIHQRRGDPSDKEGSKFQARRRQGQKKNNRNQHEKN